MKTYGDLLNRLQDFYGTAEKPKNYHPVQSEDIINYLEKRNFPLSALKNLYDLIIESESFLPKINKFKDIIDEALQSGSVSISGGLHPESPYQQLYRAQDWPIEKIIDNCKKIRRKQDQVGIDKLYSWEISFLVIWEGLCDVKPEHLSIAKERIIAHGEKGGVVDLSDLTVYHEPVNRENLERMNKTANIKTVLGEI